MLIFTINKKREKLMESNIIVSIIMPIFNVEAYLHRSIESVLKQSVSNIEFLNYLVK